MYTLKKEALVPYTVQQMFELVNTVEAYPQFLPWCQHSMVVSQSKEEVVASLTIAWQGIHKQFTTRNRLYPDERIEIYLVNGPLCHLEGIWSFEKIPENHCRVVLNLEFEVTGGIVDKILQPILQPIANKLIKAFCERAQQQYGNEDDTN